MSANDLDDCASLLESDKVKERGISCTKLSTHLENKSIVKILSNNGLCRKLIRSLQTCMKKDADKIIEDEKKKPGTPARSMAPEILIQLVNIAIKEDIDIRIQEFLGYILGCMKDFKMKKCYEIELLEILRKSILSHPKTRGKLQKEDWLDVYNLLKKLIEENYQLVNSNKNQSVKKWGPISNCFMLLIKWGPVSGLSPISLREDFEFMTIFCQKVTQNSPRFMQEDTLEVAINFSLHTAKDNRVSCCKFGEDIILSLTDLYEPNGMPSRVMELLIEFFLIQMVIHHPNGVTEGESAAYANNWSIWKKILKTMNGLLIKEINLYFKRTQKNCSFFKNTLFTKLFIEISRQLFCSNLDVVSEAEEVGGPPQKRIKRELITIRNYIECIKETKNWLWVHLVRSIIETYPILIDVEDFIYLLQILSSIQIESNEHDLIEHLYICLSTMLHMEQSFDVNQHQLWKLIGDNTTKAFGLNINKHVTEKLLEQLISRGIVDFEDAFQTYQSGLISLSSQTIRTFDSGLRFMVLNDLEKKERIMKCILPQNCIEYKYLCSKESARFLVKLTFKVYRPEEIGDDVIKHSDKYDKLKDIYLKTILAEEALMIRKTETTKELFTKRDIDFESCNLLATVVKEFVNNGAETVELLLCKVVLLANICSWLSDYNVQLEKDLKQSQFIKLIQTIFNKDVIKTFALCQSENQRDLKRLTECLDIINVLFSLKVSKWVMDELKELIPLNFLRTLSSFLNDLQEKGKRYPSSFNLKVPVTQALSNFACICGRALNKNQEYLLEILSKPSYNCSLDDDYTLLTVFLKTLKLSEPGALSDPIMFNILSCIQSLAEVRYQDKAEDILDILKGVYPHIAASKDDNNKSLSVCFLKPFYDSIQDNGPDASIRLLECIQVLCELDPKNTYSRWSDVEVIKFVPEFLKCDYHQVRLKAIDVLVTYYKANSNCNVIADIHIQEEIFAKIYNMSLAVFEVLGQITQQRGIDEVMCRTASVLLTFVNIITSSDNWIKDSLYSMLKISYVKGIEQIDRALNIINKRKYGEGDTNILEKYVLYLVEKWLDEGHSFNDFPYKLFRCETKFEFYRNYFEDCAYFLIMREQDDFKSLCEKLQLTEEEVIEKTSAKILSRAICSNVENFDWDILDKNEILASYSKIVGAVRLRETLKDNLEHVVIGILDFLTDERYIQDQLGESVIFFNKHLEANHVRQCFEFIESIFCDGQPLELLLTDIHLPKLENILFQLKLNLYKSTVVKDRLKYLHRYTFFVNMISKFLNSSRYWRHFFIRDVIHTLLNAIETNENCASVISASCTFLEVFLKKILPDLSQTFKNFLHDTVNSLKNFYFTRKNISMKCADILKFLIITNKIEFEEEIKTLDSFPDVTDFSDIKFVLKEVRYGSREQKLEDEIVQFLNSDMVAKEDSLINLRKLLASQKDTLLEMYDRLQEIRGFSEDSEKSVLHRLVCALSQLSYSTNRKVSFEAARCLGELGPANLQTVVLQPEKILVHQKHSPFEIIIGSVISVLSKYVIDCDMNVIKRASKLFYVVSHSIEGKKIIDAGGDFGFGPINKDYITPYYSSRRKFIPQNPVLNAEMFVEKLKDDKLWCPDADIDHNRWITALVSTILKTFTGASLLSKLIEVCEVKVEFSECLLPLIIDLIISKGVVGVTNLIAKQMDYFFTQHWKLTKQQDLKKNCVAMNKKSVKSMLNIVNYVRLMKKCNSLSSKSCAELTVDYLKVAKAAEFCANHFSALYYAELWCQKIIEKIQREDSAYCEKRSTMIDDIYEKADQELGETLHNILRNGYKSIGEFDALSGCGTSFLLQPKYREEYFKEQDKNYGLYQIPTVMYSQLVEPEYECLWRLGQWSFEEKKVPLSNGAINYEDFEKFRFSSLKALQNKNIGLFEESSSSQFICITNHLKNISLESSHSLYPVLTKLQSLVEMEDFSKSTDPGKLAALMEKWKSQDKLIRNNDFKFVEPVIAQRLVMLTNHLNNGRSSENALKDYIIDLSLNFAGWAKDEDLCQEGLKILENLKRIRSLSADTNHKIDLLDAQLSWSLNDTVVARQLLKRLCNNNLDISPKLRALALKLTGQYMAETGSENRTTIISDYFVASFKTLAKVKRDEDDIRSVMDTYDKLALFADREYQQIKAYMKSDSFQKKIANMEQAKKEAASIQKKRIRTTDERRAAAIHDRNSNIDHAEIRTAQQESNQFLKLALKYYLLCLIHSDDKNIRIFQIFALFLENRKNEEITATIEEYLPKLPSYKFIITLPQIIPHLSDNETDLFSTKVSEIIQRCALDHPHHTLPLLLALANAYKDREFDESKTKTATNDSRVRTVNHLLAKIKKQGLANHINRLDQVSQALIHLAYYKSPDEDDNDRKKEFSIPRNQKIMTVRDFDDVLVPTSELAVSVTKDYSRIVGISSFGASYQIVGGVNKPKKILCRGTDGKLHSQLVKGHDDLRQDAVMEQVYTIMNNLLSYKKSTKHLRIRTYKIVPLSMRSGILKWADNSMPIGEYLVGAKDIKGAHQIYRPGDKSHASCREIFKKCASRTADFKLKTYKDICKSFKPVFHHFFEDYFPQPAVWYERRRAYIHSVATTSMCGYILGIGDRHTSNILIDKLTAEVIHIDFGIAFEQGRVLPTPETVPFRLTRDMVDGMGVSGVEGIFKRSCEKTMEVLRQNAQTIITILEVLLYDPLYAWTVTAAEANRRQTESDSSLRSENTDTSQEPTNVSAERALLRLREKLQGRELGYPRSIEHQVGTLIQQAVDPENLCKLFVGWQPYV